LTFERHLQFHTFTEGEIIKEENITKEEYKELLYTPPIQELQMPPMPNSTSFSFGSVMQSRNSSRTLS
jgi:hypothetical protein